MINLREDIKAIQDNPSIKVIDLLALVNSYNNEDEIVISNLDIRLPIVFKKSTMGNLIIKFRKCKFKDHITIQNNNNPAKFKFFRCDFESNVFINMPQKMDIKLKGCNVYEEFKFSIGNTPSSHNQINLIQNTFEGILKFISGNYGNSFINLEKSIFKKHLPDFRGCELNELVNLNNFEIIDQSVIDNYKKFKHKYDELAWVARDLKLRAAETNDHLREMDFFAIESQLTAINDGGLAKKFSFGFAYFSNYGRSIGKPFGGLLLTFVFAFVINLGFVYSNQFPVNNYMDDVFIAAFSNVLPFSLGLNKESIECAFLVIDGNKIPSLAYQIFRLFISAFSLLFWFFLIFTIRNRFKIK